jgi:hypothetical protein
MKMTPLPTASQLKTAMKEGKRLLKNANLTSKANNK